MDVYEFMKPYVYENKAISETVKLPYRIYVPESYDPAKKYKVLFFMHGMGERGSDNHHLNGIEGHRYLCYIHEDEKLREEFILVAPQCELSCTWVNHEALMNYIFGNRYEGNGCSDALALVYDLLENKLAKDYNIDGSRIYMTGLSMGGFATWYTAINRPRLLAAAIPVCGGGEPQKMHQAKDVPIWTFHSRDDDVVPAACFIVSKVVMDIAGATDFHCTLYDKVGHASWENAYLDRDVFEWMLSKVNPDPEIK